jgi:hypothetical protein
MHNSLHENNFALNFTNSFGRIDVFNNIISESTTSALRVDFLGGMLNADNNGF